MTKKKVNLLVVGIQGGEGSFNEQAARLHLKERGVEHFELRYLFTTPAVLEALTAREIDCGQFAISNSIGGIVEESIYAMADHKFSIKDRFSVPIEHVLLIKKGVEISEIDTIMTHPQVLKQCKKNLEQYFPEIKKVSGEGELIDSARVAKAIAEGDLAPTCAAMGSAILAELYDLKIVKRSLQDRDDNRTEFLWVE